MSKLVIRCKTQKEAQKIGAALFDAGYVIGKYEDRAIFIEYLDVLLDKKLLEIVEG